MDPLSRSPPHVLIADHEGPFRLELKEALETDGGQVTVTDDGDVLLDALTAGEAYDGIVIGSELKGTAGLEVLYQASRAKPPRARLLFLICEARSDSELLELLRRRGIKEFIDRADGATKAHTSLQAHLYRASRVEPRLLVETDVTIEVAGASISARTADLNKNGAKVVLPARKAVDAIQVGATIALRLGGLAVPGIIRRSQLHKRLMGNEVHLGIQFVDVDEAIATAIANHIQQERDMQQLLAGASSRQRLF
jgi:DNA-binding response OmpR family regulator